LKAVKEEWLKMKKKRVGFRYPEVNIPELGKWASEFICVV